MSEEIKIFLHDTDNSIKEVLVNKYDQISSLSSFIKGHDTKYVVYEKKMLLVAFTFSFYDIQNNSHIYVYNKKSFTTPNRSIFKSHRSWHDSPNKKILHLFTDSNKLMRPKEVTTNVFDSKSNSELFFEAARLLDIRNTNKSFNVFDYKLVHPGTASPQIGSKHYRQNEQVTSSHGQTHGPSTDALPGFW